MAPRPDDNPSELLKYGDQRLTNLLQRCLNGKSISRDWLHIIHLQTRIKKTPKIME